MKKLFLVLCSFVITGTVFSQPQQYETVTVSVIGNKTKQILVDNKIYTISNTTINEEQTIVINNLENGQHALEIIKNKKASYKTTFTLREGYDLNISINSSGSLSLTEKRIENWRGNTNMPVSAAVFNKLYAATKKRTSSVSRASYLENEFTNTKKNFTSKQASQLIQLVNSESLRFKLAKESYPTITDRGNFSLVANLLKSTANRTELNNYIAAFPDEDDENEDDGNAMTPLTDEKFRVIYNEVNAENSYNDKNYYLINFFSKDFNYYTSSQARQFIQLLTGEQERLNLAKAAYRGVTDKENYSEVSQLISGSSNRAELTNYINTYDNTNVRPAMSATDFNKIYQTVYNQNTSISKYGTINSAFTSPGNYFTVAQAKQLIMLISDEKNRLQLSKISYKVLVDRSNYTQFNDFLYSQANRTDLNNYVANFNSTGSGIGSAMSDAEYNQLYKSVSDSWSASGRVSITGDAFRNERNYFTTFQVRQLLQLINDESDRLTLAKSSYDNVLDKNNFSQVYDLFNSTTSKNELAKYVNDTQYDGGVVIKTPMTESEFNKIYRDVQFTFGIGAKMSALTGVFNKETNYFTVAQVKQLIEMVSAEYNKLELAKSAYNNITDLGNFNQMYDIFSSQTSKDELAAYVRNNPIVNN